MAIIVGGDPRERKEAPVEAPESKMDLDAAPVETREAGVEASEEPKAEVRKKTSRKGRRDGGKE